MTGTVYIVHAVDAEGPLYESLTAKFERLHDLFGVTDIAPTADNLARLQRQELDLGGQEVAVARALSAHRNRYMESWDQVDGMLDRVTTPDFRDRMIDSDGQGWVFNWFCLDHVDFAYNPRRRDMGYHNVSDHYAARRAQTPSPDELHWHFHPMSTYGDAHRCATHYFRTDHVFQILCRKIIERGWFPSVFRAGFQTERPDSHWFLEQWIPFDISNMALDDNHELDNSIDFRYGRSGDWRRAPADWSVYHPSHDDYQVPGRCRRWIGRALNVLNRLADIDQREMDKAFARAADGADALVGLASHDFRDLGPEVDHVRALVAAASTKHPGVRFRFCGALDAFQNVTMATDTAALDLDVIFHPAADGDVARIEVVTRAGRVFGPQPFLAIETRSRRFLHDNFDFAPCGTRWHYAFHGDTLPIEDVAGIGIAANDVQGRSCVRRLAFPAVAPLSAAPVPVAAP